jgi:hypothetical protein
METVKPKFRKKTLRQIEELKKVLETKSFFSTKGHFYREIELVKFPWMKHSKSSYYRNGNNGRNVYSQTQYESIVMHCIEQGWIKIVRFSSGKYNVISNLCKPTTSFPVYDPAVADKITTTGQSVIQKVMATMAIENHIEIELDPKLTWVIRTEGDKNYLSIKK